MSDLYQHLAEYGLANKETVEEKVFSLKEDKIQLLLSQYRQIIQSASPIVKPLPGAMDIYPDSQSLTLSTDILKRLSLCANRIYVHDEFPELGLNWSEIDSVPRMAQNHYREERIEDFRVNLAEKINFLLEVRPLVETNIVHLLPTARDRPRRDPNGIYFDDFVSSKDVLVELGETSNHPLLTEDIQNYLLGQMKLHMPTRKIDKVAFWEDVTDCPNFIKIMLGDLRQHEFRFFDVKSSEGSSGEMLLRMFHAEDPFGQHIEPEMFRNWVRKSRYQVMTEYFEKIYTDVVSAQQA